MSPSVSPQLLIIMLGIVGFWALPFILRATGNMALATALSFQGLTVVSLVGTYFYGGFSSPFLPWFIISLMLGLFYHSKRLGLVISVFVVELFAFLGCVAWFGLPNEIPAENLSRLGWLSIVGAAIYMTWMALYYARVMALRSELEIEADRFLTATVELEHAQEMAEKISRDRSLFFAKMSHELRTWRAAARSRGRGQGNVGGGRRASSAGGAPAAALGVAAAAVAGFQRLGPFQFGLGLVESRLGGGALLRQVLLRADQIIAALARRLGEGRIGEMADIGDAGLLLLGGDLQVELARHALEIGDHQVELHQLLALLVDLEPLQPHQIFPCLHHSLLPKRSTPDIRPRRMLHQAGKQNPNSAPRR